MKKSWLLPFFWGIFAASQAWAGPFPFAFVRGPNACPAGALSQNTNVSVNGIVRTYATDGTRHFIGGDFTTVAGQTRQRFAAFDASWNLLPALNFNNSIYSLRILGNSLFAGGDFTAYGGFVSTYGGAVDPTNGNLGTIPVVNNTIQVVVPDGADGWYIGGNFSTVGGTSRPYAARILANGTLDANWLPSPNGQVYDILVDTDRIYLAGDFTTIRGAAATRLVSVDKSTGAIISSVFNANSTVYSVAKMSNGDLAVGGNFSSVGNLKATSLAKVDKTTGVYDSSFLTGANVQKILSDGNGGYYVGGSGTYGTKQYLAHVLSTGAVDTNFTAALNGSVNDLALDGSTLYVGGTFTTVNSVPRYYLAALDSTTGADLNKDMRVSGPVTGLAINTNNVYVTGPFTQAGSLNRSGSAIAAVSDGSLQAYPITNGQVMSSVPDGAGGWYIGGNFSKITDASGTYTRTNLARIAADGSVDATFTGVTNNSVVALLLHADGLYIGGSFGTVGGTTRAYFARVNPSSGALDTSFANPSLSSTVYSIAADSTAAGSDVFVGGNFTTAGPSSLSRNYLAKYSSAGVLSSWNPNASAIVYALARGAGTRLYVGGSFSTVAGSTSRAFAAISTVDGTRDSTLDPAISNGTVYAINYDPSDATLILAGNFTRTSRNGMAAFTVGASSLTLSNFYPAPPGNTSYVTNGNNTFSTLAKSGNTVFFSLGYIDMRVGQRVYAYDYTSVSTKLWESQAVDVYARTLSLSGTKLFTGFAGIAGVNGTSRLRLAAFTKSTGALNTSFQADLGTYLYEEGTPSVAYRGIEATDSRVYVGGTFTKVGSVARSFFAPLLATSGALDSSFPVTIPNNVGCLAQVGSALYIGGAFSTVTVSGTSTSRSFLAGFNESSGALLSAPNVVGNSLNACAIDADASNLYFGGSFSTMGGQRRGSVAAVDLTNNVVSSWDANAGTGTVSSLLLSAGNLIIGGNYASIGGKLRSFLAGVVVSSGEATSSDPVANGIVYKVLPNGTDLYVGGAFTSINGVARRVLAKLDTTTANWPALVAFNSQGVSGTTSNVQGLAINGSLLYVGYTGTQFIGGGTTYTRPGLVAVNLSNGAMGTLNANIAFPSSTPAIKTIKFSGNQMYLGGAFTSIGGVSNSYAASYDISTNLTSNWTPNPTGTVNSIALSASQVYLGGSFAALGGTPRTRIAKLDISDPNNIAVANWATSTNGIVRDIAFSSDSSVAFLGGSFTQVGSTAESYLAGVNVSSATTTTWAASANSTVFKLLSQDGVVYAGGQFTVANGTSRPYLAAFDDDAGNLTNWNPSAGGNVYDLNYSADDDLIYLGGNFATMGSSNRANAAAVTLTGAVAPWTADTNGDVNSILPLNGKIYLGGAFTTVRGASRSRAAATDKAGIVTPWNPAPNNTIYVLEPYNSSLISGGDFTSIHSNAARVRINQSSACD